MARRQFHQKPESRLACPTCGKRGVGRPVVVPGVMYRECRFCRTRHPIDAAGRIVAGRASVDDLMTWEGHPMAKPNDSTPPLYLETPVRWLSRDIWLGWSENDPKGKLLCGWDEGTNTRQLWELVGTGPRARAKFLGFVCKSPA